MKKTPSNEIDPGADNYWAAYKDDLITLNSDPTFIEGEPNAHGVFHGPYPQTESHPYDQSNGLFKAIHDARVSGKIDERQATELELNAEELLMSEHAEATDLLDHEQDIELGYNDDPADEQSSSPEDEEL